MGHFAPNGEREENEKKGRRKMKVRPCSFFVVILFCLGLVFYFRCHYVFAGSPCIATVQGLPVLEKIPSFKDRGVRVCLKTQRFGFYEKGVLKFSGPVCTGKKGHETPKGKFQILEKSERRLSVEYSKKMGKKVYMPYALQFTPGQLDGRGGHCLHQGEILSKPSSGGCVRLTKEDAMRIFREIKLKDSVIITD